MSVKSIVEDIKKLSALELSDLVKEIEETFNVSAAAPTVVSDAVAPAAGSDAAVEEKTEFKLVLKDAGGQKIKIIKALRSVVPGLNLKDAKEMADSAPGTVKESLKKDEAEKAKKALEEAGATVELL